MVDQYLRTRRFNTMIRTAFAGAPVGGDYGVVAMVRLLVGLLVVGGGRLSTSDICTRIPCCSGSANCR